MRTGTVSLLFTAVCLKPRAVSMMIGMDYVLNKHLMFELMVNERMDGWKDG